MAATGGFIWYELMTPDPDGSAEFYNAVVGWSVLAPNTTTPTGAAYRMIQRGDGGFAGGVLALTPDMLAHGGKPMWLGYVHVADVDATCAAFEAAGGAVHMPATDLPVGRIAMVSDPWGAALYLMAPVPPPGDPDATSDVFDQMKAQHVRWNELAASDPAGAIAFYSGVFGWTREGGMPMGPDGDYAFVQNGDLGIGAVMPLMGAPAPRWKIYIGVADIDAAAAAVAARGGTVTHGPDPIPGGEFSLEIVDPQGAVVGFVGPRTGE